MLFSITQFCLPVEQASRTLGILWRALLADPIFATYIAPPVAFTLLQTHVKFSLIHRRTARAYLLSRHLETLLLPAR